MNDDLRNELLEEQGYTICPLGSSDYTICDNDCDNCDIYKEFVESIESEVKEFECINFVPEENNPYPLCVNIKCDYTKTCNKSFYMDVEPYW